MAILILLAAVIAFVIIAFFIIRDVNNTERMIRIEHEKLDAFDNEILDIGMIGFVKKVKDMFRTKEFSKAHSYAFSVHSAVIRMRKNNKISPSEFTVWENVIQSAMAAANSRNIEICNKMLTEIKE